MIRFWLLVAIALAAGILFAAGEPARAARPGFVMAAGVNLQLDGRPFVFSGLNIYNANSDGWCWYQMRAGSELDDALTAIGPGKAAMRAWFFQPLATTGGARDWSAFDHTLSVAAAHGFRVVVTLTDQWGECGAGQDGAPSYYKDAGWYTTGYTSADPNMLSSYRNWVVEVVTRYKDDATVLMWELMNEPEVQESLGSGCLPGSGSFDILYNWTQDVSALIKSIDPDHLVTIGATPGRCGTTGGGYQHYRNLNAIPTVDVCTAHDYIYSLAMPGHIQSAIDLCTAISKPIFIGEVGMRPNDVGGTLADRAAVIAGKRDAQFAAGIEGMLVWAWSNLGSTLGNFDVGPGDPVLETLILDDNCPTTANPGQENGDGDQWGDACDSCPGYATAWIVEAGDADCDGFTDAHEALIGTDPADPCPDHSSDDAWPADFDMNKVINISDVFQVLPPYFGTTLPPTSPRRDLVPDGIINISEVFKVLPPFFGWTCT